MAIEWLIHYGARHRSGRTAIIGVLLLVISLRLLLISLFLIRLGEYFFTAQRRWASLSLSVLINKRLLSVKHVLRPLLKRTFEMPQPDADSFLHQPSYK